MYVDMLLPIAHGAMINTVKGNHIKRVSDISKRHGKHEVCEAGACVTHILFVGKLFYR